jgi:hypothetical protein
MLYQQSHLETDWTLCPKDACLEYRQLVGSRVCYRASCWSLRPRVHANDLTTCEPVTRAEQVQLDDVFFVFCQAQPRNLSC